MNKEYWDYYFSKKKKLTDRAFKLRIAMLMCSMVACAAIMASSAFALFKCTVSSSTTLTAPEFQIQHYGYRDREKSGDKVLVIRTTPEEVIGFCKVQVIKGEENYTYYTQAFSGQLELIITASSEWEVVVSEPRWGYPQNLNIDEKLILDGRVLIPEPKVTLLDETLEITGDNTDDNVSEQTSEAADIKLTSPRPTVTDDNNEENETDNTTEQNDTTESDNTTEQTEAATTPAVTEKETTTTVPESSGNETTETPAADTGSSDSSATTTESTPAVSSGENGTGNSGGSENTASSDTGSASSGSSDSGSSSAASSPVATAPSGGESSSVSDGGGE